MKKKLHHQRLHGEYDLRQHRLLQQVKRRWRIQTSTLERLSAETKRKLEENSQVYQSLFDYNPDAVYQLDLAGKFISANAVGLTLSGYSLDEVLTMSFVPMIAEQDVERTVGHFMQAAQGIVQEYEVFFRRRSGEYRAIRVINTPIFVGGEIVGVYGIAKDITLHRQAEEARQKAETDLQANERRFRALVANASDVIAVIDSDLVVLYVSPSAKSAWGYDPDLLIGSHWGALIHPLDLAHLRRLLAAGELRGQEMQVIELRLKYGATEWHAHEVTISNQSHDPAIGGFVLTCRDVTERKAFEEQLRYQAFYNSLTGLPNRALFLDRLTQAMNSRREVERHAAVIFIDLDNFKVVNDSLGHMAGDALLLAVTKRMQTCLRSGDTLARLGGDEFTILLPGVVDAAKAAEIVMRLSHSLQGSFSVGDREVFASASFGVALSIDTGPLPGDLLRAADTAMYEAKAGGKAGYEIYKSSMTVQAIERLEMEAELRQALGCGQLRLHYQPIVEMKTGLIREVEALVRWEHPRRGLIPPGKFITLAEQTGLIIPLGKWVLEEACRQAHEWHMLFQDQEALVVGVNISTRQFQDNALVSIVSDVLARTDLPASKLKLEVTESMMMLNDIAISKLHALKDIGVGIAVDDFGTGYSSMAYLAKFPLDTLKIDQSFVRQITDTDQAAAIVKAIIALAKAHDLQVVGEGIETLEQNALLQSIECEYGQGYLFSRPLTALAMTQRLSVQAQDLRSAASGARIAA